MGAIVALSGGMDSATILGDCLREHPKEEVCCFGFRYGSKHNPWENLAARRLSGFYNVPFRLIDLSPAMCYVNSALLDSGPVPEGHYEEESMRQTVVPGRNIIFLSILGGIAMSNHDQEIWIGVHTGDHYIYPDCRPDFINAMQTALRLGTDSHIALRAPFLTGNKETILRAGLSYDPPVPYHLTRTCYTSQEVACGRCGSCQERLAAWKAIGKEDPLPYAYRDILPKKPSSA